jgi:hypothetical protein
VRFWWAKGLNAKDIHKEMFPVYGGKCLSRKAVHKWVEKRGKLSTHDEEVKMEVRKWLRQQSEDFCASGFDALVKRWDKCINQCWWRICREINVFPRFECHMFYVLYSLLTYLLTLPRNIHFGKITQAGIKLH